jgi:hypothetical protein
MCYRIEPKPVREATKDEEDNREKERERERKKENMDNLLANRK